MGSCPFHPPDTNSSFAVNRRANYCYCFHGGTGGDVISFYQKMKGITYAEALRELRGRYGL
jgi:DNA primase